MQTLWFFKVFNYLDFSKIVCAYAQSMEEAAKRIETLSEYPISYWEYLGNGVDIDLDNELLIKAKDAELIGGVPIIYNMRSAFDIFFKNSQK